MSGRRPRRWAHAGALAAAAGAVAVAGGPLLPAAAQAGLPPGVFVSAEVGGNNQPARQAVADLADDWQAAVDAAGLTQRVVGAIDDASLPVVVDAPGGARVRLSLRDVTRADLARPGGTGRAAATQGGAASGTSPTMQGGAPKPEPAYQQRRAYYNESAGATDSRNGLLFTFSPPAVAFGAWFGDVETRTDGRGTPAVLRLLDDRGNRIGADVPIAPSTADPTRCGAPVDDAFVGCGNGTTRWIGFGPAVGAPVAAMLLVVGDDDDEAQSDDGNAEHLSFINPTLALPPPTPTPAPTAPPTARPSATAPPTATPAPTASPWPSATATATATSTPTATATPTPRPRPVFLPLTLREACPQPRVDVALAIDVSSSMRQPGGGGRTKLAAAVDAARTFVGLLTLAPGGDRAAIVGFHHDAWPAAALTGDAGALDAALDGLAERVDGGSRLDLALAVAAAAVAADGPASPGRADVVVLLTDGVPSGVSADDVRQAAAAVRAAGVRIHTVGLGAPGELDEALLAAIAGDRALYAYAPDAEGLRRLYAQLAAEIRCPPGRHGWWDDGS